MQSWSYVSTSTEATQKLGTVLGGFLTAGDCLVLTGDLGAGKTQFTKGIALGLGARDEVSSPTFTIEMRYESGRLPLYHFDLYRLNDACELDDIGLFDVLESDGVCVIEWGEQFLSELGDEYLSVTLTRDGRGFHDQDQNAGLGDESEDVEPARRIEFVAHGTRAEACIEHLSQHIDG